MAQSALGIPEHVPPPVPSSAPSRTLSQPVPTFASLTNNDVQIDLSRVVIQPSGADNGSPPPSMPLPRLSRSFTLPLPSQLGHLQRPQLSQSSSSNPGTVQQAVVLPSPGSEVLATELADSVQMVIQTLLQISPPQLLDPAKEQLSGCALQVPTPSISALFTSMKMLNYLSKHMASLSPSGLQSPPLLVEDEFDVGELLQNVGDALSGVAAEAGVDLVIFHTDSSLKDLRIKTDECGLIYTLSYIARQILTTAIRGDVLEIGLRLAPENGPSSVQLPATLEPNEPLFCTFEFKHKSARQTSAQDDTALRVTPRPSPNLQTSTMMALLRRLQAEVFTSPPSQLAPSQTKYDLLAHVRRADQSKTPNMVSAEEEAMRQPFPDLRLAREPTVTELLEFARTLKGRKATFHASTRSSFAHYLTIYLTGWGMDVTHVPTDTGLSTPPSLDEPITEPVARSHTASSPEGAETVSEPEKLLVPIIEAPIGPPFTIIDDDIGVLKTKLSEFEHPLRIPEDARPKRPSLAEHHRPKSFLARRAIGVSTPSGNSSVTSVIVYFTSLSNYREVKDVVQAITTPKKEKRPEIIVIPKPAGVRRFLTALYTATTKPLVDPVFFSPIATSPMSPAGRHSTPFFSQPSQSPGISEASVAPSGSSVQELATTAFSSGEPTPIQSLATSPLSTGGYFEREGSKIAGSASSGLFVKSPDGRTGIFFQPFASFEEPGSSTQNDAPGPSLASSVAETAASQARALIDGSPSGSERQLGVHPPESIASEQGRLTIPSLHPSPPIIPNSLGGIFGDPVFERGSAAIKPAKPTKASIVGTKVKKQTETVVPPISVLIVEDNAIQRTILSTFMKNKHISYGIAENGEEAVKQWEKGNYHLVLMDIQMPVMDGIEATKKIREIETARHRALGSFTPQSEGPPTPTSTASGESHHPTTPFHSSVIIVALTAQSSTQDRVAALAAGCNDFLSKPVKLQWLERKIIEWGSIKALQMWADPEVEPLLHKRQRASAQAIADNLHIGRLAKGSSAQNVEKL